MKWNPYFRFEKFEENAWVNVSNQVPNNLVLHNVALWLSSEMNQLCIRYQHLQEFHLDTKLYDSPQL